MWRQRERRAVSGRVRPRRRRPATRARRSDRGRIPPWSLQTPRSWPTWSSPIATAPAGAPRLRIDGDALPADADPDLIVSAAHLTAAGFRLDRSGARRAAGRNRPLAAGAPGHRFDDRGGAEQSDRSGAGDLGADRQVPCRRSPRQAACPQPRGGRGDRAPRGPGRPLMAARISGCRVCGHRLARFQPHPRGVLWSFHQSRAARAVGIRMQRLRSARLREPVIGRSFHSRGPHGSTGTSARGHRHRSGSILRDPRSHSRWHR